MKQLSVKPKQVSLRSVSKDDRLGSKTQVSDASPFHSSQATATSFNSPNSAAHKFNFNDTSQALTVKKTQVSAEPLHIKALSSLGEPDASAISKHDVLSAMAFDTTGKILSVGDRGGRVICFELGKNDEGQPDYEYLTEF